jgi:ribonuclease Z
VAEVGSDLIRVDAVFLTHHHWDHLAGLPHVVLGRLEHTLFAEGRDGIVTAPLRIYGPRPTERIVELLFGTGGVFDGDLASRFAPDLGAPIYGARSTRADALPIARDVEAGDDIRLDGAVVSAGVALHAQPYLASLAYRVDVDGRSIVFAGDSAPSDEVVALAADVDLLIHEGARLEPTTGGPLHGVHSSATSVADTARRSGARHLLVVHHDLERGDEERRLAVRRAIQSNYSGEVTIAYETLTLVVD